MKFPGSIHTEPDEKLFSRKNRHQLVVKQYAVGLEGVFDVDAGFPTLFLELHGAPEKSSPISVGSPPCQATVTWGVRWNSMSWGYKPRGPFPTSGNRFRDRAFPSQEETVAAVKMQAEPVGLAMI